MLVGTIILVVLTLTAVIVPFFSPNGNTAQNLDYSSIPPVLEIRKISDSQYIYVDIKLKAYEVTYDGHLQGKLEVIESSMAEKKIVYELNGKMIVIDYSASPYTLKYNDEDIAVYKKVWNKTYLLGSDQLGRDVLIRVVYGMRISLLIALVASIVNLTVGFIYGGISGYLGGMADNVMMRIVDVLRGVPRLLYVIMIIVIIGPGLKTVMLTIGLVYWLSMARFVRGQVLSAKNNEYILAAKTMGAGTMWIVFKHLIPNTLGAVIVLATLNVPGAIFTEAFLSFIGLGVSTPVASLGTQCNDALQGFQVYPYQLLFPAAAICLIVLAFSLIGDGLRDSIDPKIKL